MNDKSFSGTLPEDERYMRMAIDQAYIAEENGDVPIGCVIVFEGRVIAKAYNQRQHF